MVTDERTLKRHVKAMSKQRPHAEEKALREKSKVRKAQQREVARSSAEIDEDNWEAVADREETRRKQSKVPVRALRERASELLGTTPQPESGEDLRTGMVVSTTRRWARILMDGALVDCHLPRELAAAQKSLLAVGDRVVVGAREGQPAIEQILPRRSKLSRHDPHQESLERVVAANIDMVVHLVSVKSPPLRPGLIDRYLVAIQRGGAEPVVCVNKVDMLEPPEREALQKTLAVYSDLEVPVILVSAKTGEGIDRLRETLRGSTAVLVGHSGVGKSSTINALDPRLAIRTSEVHKQGGGRHTTTGSMLYDLGEGTLLIDTPGIREFGLWQLDRVSLRWHFPEFAEASEFCRYTDCTHTHEPVCGVKEAVLAGELSAPRYATYIRIFEEI